MKPFFILIIEVIGLYKYALGAYIIGMWLTQFNIINSSNRFVFIIMDTLYKLCEPSMKLIRRFIPNFGAIDISPVIVFLILSFIQRLLLQNI
jgi:YggT family protein